MADSTTPLCTWGQFTSGAFADLAKRYTDQQAQADLLLEATRLCEQEVNRRFAPFTGMTETHPARSVDPGKYGSPASLSYANDTVRHCWLNEHAPRYPEMWTYSNVSVKLARPLSGNPNLVGTLVQGPEPDSGHMWFDLGLPVPTHSTIFVKVTYGGGYTTMPADLVRAGKFMTASLIVRELAPSPQGRDPETLHADAVTALVGYTRD